MIPRNISLSLSLSTIKRFKLVTPPFFDRLFNRLQTRSLKRVASQTSPLPSSHPSFENQPNQHPIADRFSAWDKSSLDPTKRTFRTRTFGIENGLNTRQGVSGKRLHRRYQIKIHFRKPGLSLEVAPSASLDNSIPSALATLLRSLYIHPTKHTAPSTTSTLSPRPEVSSSEIILSRREKRAASGERGRGKKG